MLIYIYIFLVISVSRESKLDMNPKLCLFFVQPLLQKTFVKINWEVLSFSIFGNKNKNKNERKRVHENPKPKFPTENLLVRKIPYTLVKKIFTDRFSLERSFSHRSCFVYLISVMCWKMYKVSIVKEVNLYSYNTLLRICLYYKL